MMASTGLGFRRRILSTLIVCVCAADVLADESDALDALRQAYPSIKVLRQNSRIDRLHSGFFSTGDSARDSAERFRTAYSDVFGVPPEDLKELSDSSRDSELPLMFDRQTGAARFELISYAQERDGVAVFRSELRLLVRNESQFPLVLAASSLKSLGQFEIDPQALASLVDPEGLERAFAKGRVLVAAEAPELIVFGDATPIIWAGTDDDPVATPKLALMFEAADSGDVLQLNSKWLYLTDAESGDVLYKENRIFSAEVNGNVSGWALVGVGSEFCSGEANFPLPYAEVRIPGETTYTDILGDYLLDAGAAPNIVVESPTEGLYFSVNNQLGPTVLSANVSPPATADFVHNLIPDALNRAEVNAYFYANIIRDYVLDVNPAFPTIGSQTDFLISVNEGPNAFCPGDAAYTGVSMRFCAGAGGFANTAWSSIIYHEYGHHIVETGGSGQGQYGEGIADSMSVLLLDDPNIGLGLDGRCNFVLRSANNAATYPCSDVDPHVCGNVLSGCVWDTRNQLMITNPGDYSQILGDLLVNSVLLHAGSSITPSITIDFLTLDDDDADIGNGTPHSAEILAGFGAHNMSPADPPTNDACIDAISLCPGTITGSVVGAISDGSSRCARSNPAPDVWYRYTPDVSGGVNISLCGATTNYDSAISIHTGCPGQVYDEVTCDDDGCGTVFGPSVVNFFAIAGQTYYVRVTGFLGSVGDFELVLIGPACQAEIPEAIKFRFPNGRPASVPANTPTALTVEIKAGTEVVDPSSATLHYRDDGGAFQPLALMQIDSETFTAVLPGAGCDSSPEYYFSATGGGATTVTSPVDAPASLHRAFVGVPQTLFVDDFETDLGWVVSGVVSDGDWERGVPVNKNRGDPDTDFDGSGQCYLTDNDPINPNSDVDLGTTILTSPPFDLNTGGVINYAYWIDDGPLFLDEDFLVVEIATDPAGAVWTPLRAHVVAQPIWQTDSIFVGTEVAASATVRVRFSASDLASGTIVECAVDAIRVEAYACDDSPTCADGIMNQGEARIDCGGPCAPCECTTDAACDDGMFCTGVNMCDAFGMCSVGQLPCAAGEWCREAGAQCVVYGDGDFDSDGDVDLKDFAKFQACFGSIAGLTCEPGNMIGTGVIDAQDFEQFVAGLVSPNP